MKKFIGFILFFGLGVGLVWGWRSGHIPRMLNSAVHEVEDLAEASPEGSEEGDQWAGTWRNEKYGSSGEIACRAESADGNRWKARFTGEFQGEPFSYDVEMTGREDGDRTVFKGDADVDGDGYHWEGHIGGNEFVGSFRSESGNHGKFRMRK